MLRLSEFASKAGRSDIGALYSRVGQSAKRTRTAACPGEGCCAEALPVSGRR